MSIDETLNKGLVSMQIISQIAIYPDSDNLPLFESDDGLRKKARDLSDAGFGNLVGTAASAVRCCMGGRLVASIPT